MLGKRIINTATGAAPSACTTDTVQILDGVPLESIATYQLDGNANDLTTNYNGTASNITYSTGQFGQAGVFNGSSSKVDLPNFMPSGNASRSISMWIKTTTTAYSSLFRYGVGATNNYFLFRVNTGTHLGVAFYANDYDVDVSSTGLFDGNWHQVAMTYDGTTIRLYVDGAEQGSGYNAGSTNTTASAGRLGYQANPDGSSASSYFNGGIDQVRIFNTALSAGAVTNLYNETVATASNSYINLPSLVAYYKMSDATDETGSYDGTPTNVNFNVAGKFGNAGSFNGASSFIAVPAGLRKNNNFTASIWFNTNSTTDGQSLISFRNGKKFEVVLNNSNVGNGSIRVNAGNNTAVDSAAGIFTTNTWYNLVVVQSSVSGVTVYLNNSVVASNSGATGDLVTVTGLDSIGAYNNNGSFFNGSIDQFRYFNRAITANEVTTLYDEVQCIPTIVPSEHFNPVIYTGDGTTNNPITSLDFQPDLVWIKNRNSTQSHRLYDSVRGANLQISSNQTAAESNSGGLTSFDSNGFSLDNWASVNTNNNTYVAWNWKAGGPDVLNEEGTIDSQVSANVDAGFSIVTWTGNGAATGTVGHGLTQPPQIVLQKGLGVDSWFFANNLVNGGTNYEYSILNTTDVQSTNWTFWDGADAPNSFTFKNGWDGNREMINYCFHSVEGFSKFGSYVGSSASNSIVTGFRPAFVMIKRTNLAGGRWVMVDDKRGDGGFNVAKILNAQDTLAEITASTYGINFNSNGFSIPAGASGNINTANNTYIFMAFAADPTVEPTLEDSFNTVTYTGDGGTQGVTGVGFQPDLVWTKGRTVAYDHGIQDSVRGINSLLYPSLSQQETITSIATQSFDLDGFTYGSNNKGNASGTNYVAWAWKGAELPAINNNGSIPSVVSANPAAGFSIVKYTAGGTATVGHGLSSAPELIITKNLDISEQWFVYAEPVGTQKFLGLNTTSAAISNSGVYTNVGATTFTNNISSTSRTYINYCFHSVDGYQKVGSYTGDGTSSHLVVTGFQPRFVMFKKYDSTGNWYISDNLRRNGDNVLRPNTSETEFDGGADRVDFEFNGFRLKNNDGEQNGLNQNYIYLAIA